MSWSYLIDFISAWRRPITCRHMYPWVVHISSLKVPDDFQTKAWFFWQETKPRRDFVKQPDSIIMCICKWGFCGLINWFDQFGFDQTTCFTFEYNTGVWLNGLSLSQRTFDSSEMWWVSCAARLRKIMVTYISALLVQWAKPRILSQLTFELQPHPAR